jgi:hypothetical protein
MKRGKPVWRGRPLDAAKRVALGLAPAASGPVKEPPPDRALEAVEEGLKKAMAQVARIGEPYLSIDDVCKKFDISRTTFYELLPAAEAAEVVVRVPPPTGVVRVPVVRFEAWLATAMKDRPATKKLAAKGRK